MTRWLLTLELIDGPAIAIAGIVAAALLFVVVLVRPRYPFVAAIAAVAGFVVAYVAAHLAEAADAFGGPLPVGAAVWGGVAGGLVGVGLIGIFSRPWWRRILGVLLVLAAIVSGGLGVNRAYGVTHTLGAIIGIQTLDSEGLPDREAVTADPATLYRTWEAPAIMPAKGRVSALTGADAIPATGYSPRAAALYLPPAALVPNPPELPVVVFMMGQPGTPDPTALATAFDAFAAKHAGLAPIAIVADQITAPELDPACQDSARYGNVATYFTADIPAFITARLNVVPDHRYWVIGGYSNGGACALKWGAEHPEVWGNVIDISGNEFPGSETVDQTVAGVFGGDRAAFEAAKPASILAKNAGRFDGHVAVFTRGGDDGIFGPGIEANAAAASAAGFTVFSASIPGAGHVGAALDQGLARSIELIAPSLGLAPPP